MKDDLNKNLSKLGKVAVAGQVDRGVKKAGSWVTSVVMVVLLPVAIGLMVGVYFLVQMLNLPNAIVIVVSIIVFIGWIVFGGLVGNWVRNAFWGKVRGR